MAPHSSEAASSAATMFPPGTVHLQDTHASPGQQLVLQPRPTVDPNDPLNWSKWRKYLNMGLVCFYVAMVAEFINAATPTWGPMHKELGYSFEVLNDSYAAGCASLAVGCLLLIPFALKFGRRPIYLFSTVVQFALSIWSAKMRTVADLMLINVIQCLFGSLAEVIVQMTIADVFFVHQRGRMNALYVWVWLLSSYLGSFIAGFVAQGQGWRWVWWWNVIIFGVAILVVAFAYEETKYNPLSSNDNSLRHEAEPSDPEPPNYVSSHDLKDGSGVNKALTDLKTTQSNGATAETLSISRDDEAVPVLANEVVIDHSIPKKTYWQKLALTTTTAASQNSHDSFLRHIYQPLILLATIPAITFSALVYGILVGLGDVMSATISTFLTEPPYNFSPSQIGLMHLPRMIGVTIGALIVGPLSDWWIVHQSRRRNGIYDPEIRLWCMVPFLPFVPVGALMFGLGLNDGRPWPIIAVGLVLYNIGVTPINALVVTYLTDSYKEIVGEALVGVTVVRNTFSTAFIFALTPWISAVGIKWVFVTILIIACVILMTFGLFIRWGKLLRCRTARRYEYYAARQYKERK